MFGDVVSVLERGTNPQNKLFGVLEICMEFCGTVEVWINSEHQNVLVKYVKAEYFAKGYRDQKNASF